MNNRRRAIMGIKKDNPYGTEGLAYTLSADGTYYICSGIGTATETDIVIGSIHEELPVKELKALVFRSNYRIRTLIIADSIELIGSYACYDTTLRQVVIGENVYNIDSNMLAGNYQLQFVVFKGETVPNGCIDIFNYHVPARLYVNYKGINNYKLQENLAAYINIMFPAVANIAELINIDTSIYTRAYVWNNDKQYTYDGNQWNEV